MCNGGGVFVFGQSFKLAYGATTVSTPIIYSMTVRYSFNHCRCNASYTGSSIKGVNVETRLNFIMNYLGCILLAAQKCDGQRGESGPY